MCIRDRVKDLYAMKKAGITRAYIGNIDIGGNAYGDVKIFTPEWWDAIHAASLIRPELRPVVTEGKSFPAAWHSLITVSYTHLDVYKRQP